MGFLETGFRNGFEVGINDFEKDIESRAIKKGLLGDNDGGFNSSKNELDEFQKEAEKMRYELDHGSIDYSMGLNDEKSDSHKILLLLKELDEREKKLEEVRKKYNFIIEQNKKMVTELKKLLEQLSFNQITLDGNLEKVYGLLSSLTEHLLKVNQAISNSVVSEEHCDFWKELFEVDRNNFIQGKAIFLFELQKRIEQKETNIENIKTEFETENIKNDNLQGNGMNSVESETKKTQDEDVLNQNNSSQSIEENKKQDSIFNDNLELIQSYSSYEKNDIIFVEYNLKNGEKENVIVENRQKIEQEIYNYMNNPNLPPVRLNDIHFVEQFLRTIIKHLQLYYKIKEYMNFKIMEMRGSVLTEEQVENEFKLFFTAKTILEQKIRKELELASDLAPLWWHGECPKYPNLHYSGANPYNLHGVDGKYNYLLKPEEDNVIYERQLMFELTSLKRGQISSQKVFNSIYGINKLEMLIKEKNDLNNIEGKSY